MKNLKNGLPNIINNSNLNSFNKQFNGGFDKGKDLSAKFLIPHERILNIYRNIAYTIYRTNIEAIILINYLELRHEVLSYNIIERLLEKSITEWKTQTSNTEEYLAVFLTGYSTEYLEMFNNIKCKDMSQYELTNYIKLYFS